MSALQPWREQLRSDPARVVAGVLDGWLDRGPWQRAEPMDFLLDLADSDADLSEETAAAVLKWARDKLSWDDRRRLRFGEIAHASRLADGFAVLQRLEAPRTAYQLAEQHAWFESRTRSLQFDGHLDLHRRLWMAIAFQQYDDRFLPRWLDFCGRAARLRPGWQDWLRLGLMGLRKLDKGQLSPDQQALAGLLVFHQRAPQPLPPETAQFERQQLGVLKTLFPRGPTYWPDKLAEARERWPERREMPVWLRESRGAKNVSDGEKGRDSSRQSYFFSLPTHQEIREMEIRIKYKSLSPELWRDIVRWFRRSQEYALHTGDSYSLVKSVGNFGNKLLKRQPEVKLLAELLNWVRIALDWDIGDAHRWTQLAECLLALNCIQEAENILWEALRRFPDDEFCRTNLAKLLCEHGNIKEAEFVLREAVARFPDNDVCSNSLAELLIDLEQWQDAEIQLHKNIQRFDQDAVCRNMLAELLINLGRVREAIFLLRKAIKSPASNERSYTILVKLLINNNEENEALYFLNEGIERFPTDKVLRDIHDSFSVGKYDSTILRQKMARHRKPAASHIKPTRPIKTLPDPLYNWAAERVPVIRLAFGFDSEVEIRERLTEAARTGGAAELAEVALHLLFQDDATPLDDALRARPGSSALRLLRADKDAAQGLRIVEDAPETRPVIEALYQTETDSEAWRYRFRAAVLACADLSPPPVWPGASVAA